MSQLVQRVSYLVKSIFTPRKLHEIEQRRIRRLEREWQARGYTTVTNKRFFSGVDIQVFNEDWKLCVVIESANYSSTSRMHPNTFKRYIRELTFYEGVDKILVISFKKNMSKKQWQGFIDNNIAIRIEQFQD